MGQRRGPCGPHGPHRHFRDVLYMNQMLPGALSPLWMNRMLRDARSGLIFYWFKTHAYLARPHCCIARLTLASASLAPRIPPTLHLGKRVPAAPPPASDTLRCFFSTHCPRYLSFSFLSRPVSNRLPPLPSPFPLSTPVHRSTNALRQHSLHSTNCVIL